MQRMEITSIEFVSTNDLIEELASRHSELIVIREVKKEKHKNNIFVKTGVGRKHRKDKKFDLMIATEMLHAAQWQLIYDYLDDNEEG